MNSKNERSDYLCDQYGAALGEQLKSKSSQYVLADMTKNNSNDKAQIRKVDSEYVLRELQNQADKDQSYSRDAPDRPFLMGTPVSAKVLRTQIESLDNAIVIPHIYNGKVYFTTHGEADARTAVEGSISNPNLNEGNAGAPKQEGIDLHKVKFTFAQLVGLLGSATCQRLEREFAKKLKLSETEINQLRTARESISELALATARSTESVRTANSLEPNLLSTRTANSVEPNLLSVYSARSPGVFTTNEGILTAQSVEPNLLSVRTANSLEPNLLSVTSAKDLTTMSQLKAQSPGILTARDLPSTRTALSATSLSDRESKDVLTALEIQSPTTGVSTAQEFATPSGSTQSVSTANEIESIRSSQDVLTAVEIMTDLSRSSQDVRTAIEISDNAGTQMTI